MPWPMLSVVEADVDGRIASDIRTKTQLPEFDERLLFAKALLHALIPSNVGNEGLATVREPHPRISSQVRYIARLGLAQRAITCPIWTMWRAESARPC